MTRAARTLGVSQPALSAAMRRLEDEVGAALLDRTGRGVSPTAAGRAFLALAQDAVRAADGAARAVRELTGLQTGSIRVGGGATAAAYVLPRAVHALRARHPGLRFYVREAGSTQVAAAVISGELDVGIVTLPLAPQDDGQLLSLLRFEDELRLIVPRAHPLERKRTFRWTDLSRRGARGADAGEPVVAFEAGSAVRHVLDEAAAAAGVRLNVVMELRSIESITRMVSAGVGVGFVSRLALGRAEGLACADGRLTRTLAVVRRRDAMPSAAVVEFERELSRVRHGR